MSSSAVAQQAGSAAGYDPAQPGNRARPRFRVPRRIVEGVAVLGAATATHCGRYQPAAQEPSRIDTGTSRVGLRFIVRAAQLTRGTP
jgi:hypothetical protein